MEGWIIWSALLCIEGLKNQFDNLQSSRVGQEAYWWPKECAAYGTRLWDYGSIGVWEYGTRVWVKTRPSADRRNARSMGQEYGSMGVWDKIMGQD